MQLTTSQHTQKEQLKPFLDIIYAKTDRLVQYFLCSLFVFGLCLAFYYDTWLIAIGVGGLCLAAYYLTKLLLPAYTLHHYVASGVFAIFTAQFIYQMHGLFEMHFFVFITSIVLIRYQNWRVQLPLMTLVVIHHGAFAYMQYAGLKTVYFTQQSYMDLQTFLFHGSLASLGGILSGATAYVFYKQTVLSVEKVLLYQNNLINVQANITFAEEISKGNLNVKVKANEDDALSKALLNMQESLVAANEREQQERFKTVGLAEIGDILRANHNLNALAEEVIVKLVKYMKANQGGIFILNEDSSTPYLELAACYAYERKKHLEKRIDIGEGLVGQAVQENDTIYLTDVPNHYINITSGLGGANPTSVLIVPLRINDKIEGVIELASFNNFQKYEIEFVEKLGESIASTISSVKINERTKHLLEESQIQTEAMRAQEEEMRQNMEELAATQEEMDRKRAEMEKLVEESESRAWQLASSEKNIKSIVEGALDAIIKTDAKGIIEVTNPATTRMFGYSTAELTGKSIQEILPIDELAGIVEHSRNRVAGKQKDGTVFMIEWASSTLKIDNQLNYMFYIRDVDMEIKKENELLQTLQEVENARNEMHAKQIQIEDLLKVSQMNEEQLRGQEEYMKQHLEEMKVIQEELKEKAAELEKTREEEKSRSGALVASQKKIMETVLNEQRKKEESLQTEVAQLKRELEEYKKRLKK
jgi:methyl-accepting chemotaxis protein